ncbi:MAG TPA: nitrilase-related carbon-nitrogen hydrolase [Thermoanaerobaculia bacterium]|nr:nitrilase-related carbon-nitrogen hydrolase [Thermoanaerobaculia bacterium]
MTSLRIALGQYDIGWHDPEASLSRAADLIGRAASAGARVVLLPEMCTIGFTMDAARYAEPIDGPSAQRLSAIARSAGVYVIAGLATRASDAEGLERYYNSALLFAPDGSLKAEYRKQRLFAYADEEKIYSAGDHPVVVDIDGLRLGLLICFDLRFPELFSAIAPHVDAISVIASWPSARQSHWETLLRARAIESQAYVIGVNRIGRGGKLDYLGGSAVFDPWGAPLALEGDPPIAMIDAAVVASTRKAFPMVRDRRGDGVQL